MRKITNIIIISSFCILIHSCSDNELFDNHVIDLDSISRVEAVNMSSLYANDAKVILLDTIQDALLGGINKVISCADNSLLVLDKYVGQRIILFNPTGKFLYQIGKLGEGPGEYHSIDDFTYSPETNEVYIWDNFKKKILIYDVHYGSFVKDLDCLIESRYIHYHNGMIYLDNRYQDLDTDTNPMIIAINPQTKDITEYFMDKYSYAVSGTKLFPNDDGYFLNNYITNNIRYNYSFSNILFTIEDERMIPWITFISSEWINDDELKSIDFKSPIFYSELIKMGKFSIISNFVEVNEKIHCTISKGLENYYVHADLNSGESFLASTELEDILYKGVPFRNLNLRFGQSTKNGVYYYLNVDEMFLEPITHYSNKLSQKGTEQISPLLKDVSNYNGAIFYYEYK